MIRNGAASLDTYVTGLAHRATGSFVVGSHPSKPVRVGFAPAVQKFVTPYQSITACTRLDSFSFPPSPSNSFTPAVSPISAIRCPPDDAPHTPNRSLSS